MYRIYNIKNKKWITNNIYLSPYPQNEVYTLQKGIFGKEKLKLENIDDYVVHYDVGIVDKNDTLVFEGDYIEAKISEDKVIRGVVAFANELASYILLCLDEDYYYVLGEHVKENIKVVGNVFDNNEKEEQNSKQTL